MSASVFPLLKACRAHDDKEVRRLLRSRADPNKANEKGSNGLIAAAMRGNTNICKLLVNANARVDHVNFNGDTPLSLSIWKNHQETGLFLISNAKSSLDRQDKFGDTPLLDASKGGMYTVVRKLLDAKANPNHSNKKGATALSLAKTNGHSSVVKLLQGVTTNTSGTTPHTNTNYPLLSAIRQNAGLAKIKKLTKSNGSNVNKLDAKGISPLIAASIRGYTDVCKFLVGKGANVDYRSPNGDSALSLAIWKKHATTAIFLVEHARTTIDAYDKFGDTPLIDAVKGNLHDVVRALVKKGADVNHKNKKGDTPLSLANTKPDITSILKGDLRVRRSSVRQQTNNTKDTTTFPLLTAVRQGDQDTVVKLLAEGANPNQTNPKSISPLIAAAIRGQTSMCELLIEKRANVDHVTLNDDSPLSLSIWKKKTETALFLIPKALSTFDRSDKFGDTPLIDACKARMLPVVRALLAKGANPKHKNNKGETAISICEAKNFDDLLGELRRKPEDMSKLGPGPGFELPPSYGDALYDDTPQPNQPPSYGESEFQAPSQNFCPIPPPSSIQTLSNVPPPSSAPPPSITSIVPPSSSFQIPMTEYSEPIPPPSISSIGPPINQPSAPPPSISTIEIKEMTNVCVPIQKMTCDQVCEWLRSLNLNDAAACCETEKLDGEVLAELTPEDYVDMSLPSRGIKKKQFTIKFEKLKKEGYTCDNSRKKQKSEKKETDVEFGPGMDGVKAWLKSLGLEKYAYQFEEEEYDNLDFIKGMDSSKVEILIKAVGMKQGSAERLRKALGV